FDTPVEAGVEQTVDLEYQTTAGMPLNLRSWIGQGSGMGATGDAAVIDAVQVTYGSPPGRYFDGDSQPVPPDMGLIDPFAPYVRRTANRERAATIFDGQPMWSAWGTSDPVTPTHRYAFLASAVDPARTWQ